MTSLAAAVSRDSRGASALYLVTDSRITWGDPKEHWDVGRKTFASPASADVFAYCGDAYFVPIALGQALNMVACGVVDLSSSSALERHAIVLRLLESSLARISTKHALPVYIFHGAREGDGMKCKFRLWKSEFNPTTRSWMDSELPLDDRSYLASLDGSGAVHVARWEAKVTATPAAGTSRAAIHAFCQSLHSGADQLSGGAPQLVGLWREKNAKQFGFCWHGDFYIAGMQSLSREGRENIPWFNHLFERCDGLTGRRLKGSPSHRRSLQVK